MSKEFSFLVDGKKYTITAPTARDSAAIQDYLNKNRPDPVEELLAVTEKLPENMREKFLNDRIDKAMAEKSKKHNYKHEEVVNEISEHNLDFVAYVNSFYFKKHHPELTPDEALDVMFKYSDNDPEKMSKIVNEINDTAVKVKQKRGDAERNFFRG